MTKAFVYLVLLITSLLQLTSAEARKIIQPDNTELNGFEWVANYLDSNGKTVAKRYTRMATGMPLYLITMDTAPQAALWVDLLPNSNRGEAHALEHVLLGKGTTGKYYNTLTDMRLGDNMAATFLHFVYYQFYTTGGTSAFFGQMNGLFSALFASDASDDEIQGEIYHWGVQKDSEGKLTLAEKGAVYNEMEGAERRDGGSASF